MYSYGCEFDGDMGGVGRRTGKGVDDVLNFNLSTLKTKTKSVQDIFIYAMSICLHQHVCTTCMSAAPGGQNTKKCTYILLGDIIWGTKSRALARAASAINY